MEGNDVNHSGVVEENNVQLCPLSRLEGRGENVNMGGSDHVVVGAPEVGMTFTSWKDVECAYKVYGKAIGFGVTRVQAAVNARKERRGMTWKRECYGSPHLKKMSEEHKEQRVMEIGGSLSPLSAKTRIRK